MSKAVLPEHVAVEFQSFFISNHGSQKIFHTPKMGSPSLDIHDITGGLHSLPQQIPGTEGLTNMPYAINSC